MYDFDRTLTSVFSDIAFTIQDPIFKVRQHMLRKLSEALPPQRIMPRWNAIPFLTAADPESDIKTTVSGGRNLYVFLAVVMCSC